MEFNVRSRLRNDSELHVLKICNEMKDFGLRKYVASSLGNAALSFENS